MSQSYLETIRTYYPDAYYAEFLEQQVLEYLRIIQIDPQKVMTANSVCSDDINAMQFPISDSGLLGPFYLGGLDGFPFTGLTGMQAFAHHMPEQGALLIYFGPHNGITKKGVIGKVLRTGQDHDSDCCGAAQAALKKIDDRPAPPTLLDYQEDKIVDLFQQHKSKIKEAPYPIKEATEVMYRSIDERIHLLVNESMDSFKGKLLILVGSIFINVDDGSEACIAPRCFQTIDVKTKKMTDHLENFKTHMVAMAAK
jgi:hypothetical protein